MNHRLICTHNKDGLHDFESNDLSDYCANGCGEKWALFEIKVLNLKIEKLKALLDKAISAVEFYANVDNWENPSTINDSDHLAAKALTEIKKEMGE